MPGEVGRRSYLGRGRGGWLTSYRRKLSELNRVTLTINPACLCLCPFLGWKNVVLSSQTELGLGKGGLDKGRVDPTTGSDTMTVVVNSKS